MTAKLWYWTGLWVLMLSIGSSSTGRCWVGKAAGALDQLRATALPYMAMTEMAIGRTQSGLGHMQAARETFEQEAEFAAATARVQGHRARIEALSAPHAFKVVANYPGISDFTVQIPEVRVGPNGVLVQSRHRAVVCPQAEQIRVVTPPVPPAPAMQDPI